MTCDKKELKSGQTVQPENADSNENAEPVDQAGIPEVPPEDASNEPEVELAEYSIALQLMPNGRVQFLKPDLPALREANDEDILSLLQRGTRQLERMIAVAMTKACVVEGCRQAAHVGSMAAVQFVSNKAKGGIIIPQ